MSERDEREPYVLLALDAMLKRQPRPRHVDIISAVLIANRTVAAMALTDDQLQAKYKHLMAPPVQATEEVKDVGQ